MRQITLDAVNAFRNNEDFRRANTEVACSPYRTSMYLHGNLIACRTAEGLSVNHCGWTTPTTKERLNGLLSACGCQGIYQQDFTWYWDDGTEFSDGWQVARE